METQWRQHHAVGIKAFSPVGTGRQVRVTGKLLLRMEESTQKYYQSDKHKHRCMSHKLGNIIEAL